MRKANRIRQEQSKRELVLDTSVAMAWFFEDEEVPYANHVEKALSGGACAIVPTLWHVEMANALLMGLRRKRTTAEKLRDFVILMSDVPVVVDAFTHLHAWSGILVLAQSHGLSAYDAAYLELAQRRNLPLATLDKRLRTAARAAGISLYIPKLG